MSNTYLDKGKDALMEWFRENRSRVGYAISIQDLIRIRNNEPNPKVADCFVDALKALETDGKIELKKTDMGEVYALTLAGYDLIYNESYADYLEQAKETIMSLFEQRASRIGDVLTGHDIIRLQNDERNPKIADCLAKAFEELAADGLVELKGTAIGKCYALTQKGFDAIY